MKIEIVEQPLSDGSIALGVTLDAYGDAVFTFDCLSQSDAETFAEKLIHAISEHTMEME